jgi:hypothetical protein
MAFPTDTFEFSLTHRDNYDGCDRCGARTELWHNDWTGEALCGACDGLRDRQEAEDAVEAQFRKDYPLKAKRLDELERVLVFANDTADLLFDQIVKLKADLAEYAE